MKVYLVIFSIAYEGSDVKAVFSTLEAANLYAKTNGFSSDEDYAGRKYKETLHENGPVSYTNGSGDSYYVEIWEVD